MRASLKRGLAALVVVAALGGTTAAAERSLAARAARFPPVGVATAAFEQEREVSLVEEVLRSSGTITLAAPDDLRLELVSPERLVVVVDGDSVRALDATGKPLPLPPEVGGLTHFARQLTDLLLLGKSLQNFEERWEGPDRATLAARDPSAPFPEITLTFSPSSPLPSEIVLRERGGDRTTIHLTPLKIE